MQKWNKIQKKCPENLQKKKHCYTEKVIYFLIIHYMINSFFTIGSKAMRPNRFYRETVDSPESSNSKGMKPIETMKDPGYHIGKIDTQTLNNISDFWLKIENGKNEKGEGIVMFNRDGKFQASISRNDWQTQEVPAISIDKWTKELKTYALKQDGWNNPNAPLRVMSVNHDGTTDYINFEKKKPSEMLWTTEVDQLLQKWAIKPSDLDNPQVLQKIIINWAKISNESVRMIKELIIKYAQWVEPNYKDKPRNLAEAAEFSNRPWYDLANTTPEKISVESIVKGKNWNPGLKASYRGGRELITFGAD